MNDWLIRAGQVIIGGGGGGGKLHLSLGCPPDKLNSLAYFEHWNAQADLSLCWAHIPLWWLFHELALISLIRFIDTHFIPIFLGDILSFQREKTHLIYGLDLCHFFISCHTCGGQGVIFNRVEGQLVYVLCSKKGQRISLLNLILVANGVSFWYAFHRMGSDLKLALI